MIRTSLAARSSTPTAGASEPDRMTSIRIPASPGSICGREYPTESAADRRTSGVPPEAETWEMEPAPSSMIRSAEVHW